MWKLILWWRDEISERPAMGAVLAAWLITASWNASMGHTIGGGGMGGWSLGAVFVLVAALGAYAAHNIRDEVGLMRAGHIAMIVIQLCLGQVAGWQSLGLQLDRGATQIETGAKAQAVAKSALKRAEDERAAIGTPRPIATIEAEENLECQIKSKIYRDGIGPKCTRLKAELGAAKRAAELDVAIPKLQGKLGSAPPLTDAGAATAVPRAFAAAVASFFAGQPVTVTAEDVRFALEVFVVAILEFVGTLGPWLFGRRDLAPAPTRGPSGGAGGARVDGYRPGGGARAAEPHDMRSAVEAVLGGAPARSLPAPAPMPLLAAPVAPWATEGARMSAPIHINVGGYPMLPGPDSSAHVRAADARPAASGQPKGYESWASEAATRERHDLAALSADAPPVDRSRMRREIAPEEREAADVILAFRAACVVDAPGGVVDAENVYRRYAAWAGERALAPEAFVSLLAAVTGLEPAALGGLPHYRGVALRVGRRLEAVA